MHLRRHSTSTPSLNHRAHTHHGGSSSESLTVGSPDKGLVTGGQVGSFDGTHRALSLLPPTLTSEQQCLTPSLSRSMATETQLPADAELPFTPGLTRRVAPEKNVTATVYDFPSMEPLRFTEYPANQLHLPLRRDLLHRAVIFEADGTRQGTASTKWRDDVHGGHRKHHRQKGTGMARAGDRQSPIRRGGGVAFGPKPRDFSTKLPRKIYDLALRTALSYRYSRGELIIVQKIEDSAVRGHRWLQEVMDWNRWGQPFGKSMIVTRKTPANFFNVMNTGDKKTRALHGEAISDSEVDVKDLLSLGRLVIEKRALDWILSVHSSDLNKVVPSAVYPSI